MENKNLINESTSSPPNNGITAAEQLISYYKHFLDESSLI